MQILRDLMVEFQLVQLIPRESHSHPLIQVADLFAGVMPYSYSHYIHFERWAATFGDQEALPGMTPSPPEMSRSEKERFVVLRELNRACKVRRLYVSLQRNRGLCTTKPAMPINFWPYEAQSEHDRAPTKSPRWLRGT